jgi:hypothetical protein
MPELAACIQVHQHAAAAPVVHAPGRAGTVVVHCELRCRAAGGAWNRDGRRMVFWTQVTVQCKCLRIMDLNFKKNILLCINIGPFP